MVIFDLTSPLLVVLDLGLNIIYQELQWDSEITHNFFPDDHSSLLDPTLTPPSDGR